MKTNEFGFSLVELVVVMGIAAVFFGFVTFNLVGEERVSSIRGASDALVSDLASQQTKAMNGIGTTSGTSYGIYFQSDKYILFKGNSYSATDSANFAVNIGQGSSITNIKFPNSSIIFSARTGSVSGFVNGSNSVTINDLQGTKNITITVNRYGVVTGEN